MKNATAHRVYLEDLRDSDLVTDTQAAQILTIPATTLNVWRSTGRVNLPYVKIGRLVRYKAGDLREFIDRRTRTHTGEVAREGGRA